MNLKTSPHIVQETIFNVANILTITPVDQMEDTHATSLYDILNFKPVEISKIPILEPLIEKSSLSTLFGLLWIALPILGFMFANFDRVNSDFADTRLNVHHNPPKLNFGNAYQILRVYWCRSG
ncbi:unnamed protein product [Hymenolepis diminuta]|uniref:Uncharacterized protein n=1 Tax=Hymenolepis diminuta TaxID=6216 RepID=A0A564ZAF0_HYMDI|nr:unnamed protein product [Hymenolepis diminuta]